MRKFFDDPFTLLHTAIVNGTRPVTFDVEDVVNLDGSELSADFDIRIDNELLKVTSVTVDGGGAGIDRWTAAYLGGAAAGAHAASAQVDVLLTANGLTVGLADYFLAIPSSPSEGDMLYYHTGAWSKLAIGANNAVLTSNGTDPAWVVPTDDDSAYALVAGATFTGDVEFEGQIIDDTEATGSDTQVLTKVSGHPRWAASAGGGGGGGAGSPAMSARAYLSGAHNTSNGSYTIIPYNNTSWDTNTAFDTTNSWYVVPTGGDGKWLVIARTLIITGGPTYEAMQIQVDHGSGFVVKAPGTDTGGNVLSSECVGIIDVVAGDKIRVVMYSNAVNAYDVTDSMSTWVEFASLMLSAMTNPMADKGSIIYASDDAGTPAALNPDTASNGDVLTYDSGTDLPKWAAPAGGGGGTPFYLDTIAMHGTYGDDFTAASLDAKWTPRANASAHAAATGRAGTWLQAAVWGGSHAWTQTPGAMADEVDIACKISAEDTGLGGMTAGIYFVNNSGDGLAFVTNWNTFFNIANVTAYGYTSWAAQGGSPDNAMRQTQTIWMRLVKVGIQNLYFAYLSLDGNNWGHPLAFTNSATMTRFGFGVLPYNPGPIHLNLDWWNVLYSRTLGNDLTDTPVGGGTVTATASSNLGGYGPANAIDDTWGDGWSLNAIAPPDWLKITWSVAQDMNKIVWYSRENYGSGYIEFSDGSFIDGVAWPNDSYSQVNFTTKTGITWIKLWSTGGASGNAGIRELAVFKAT